MGTKRKVLYEAPSTIVFEVKFEGIICQSKDQVNGSLNPMGAPVDLS